MGVVADPQDALDRRVNWRAFDPLVLDPPRTLHLHSPCPAPGDDPPPLGGDCRCWDDLGVGAAHQLALPRLLVQRKNLKRTKTRLQGVATH